jgi:hypothetical protein
MLGTGGIGNQPHRPSCQVGAVPRRHRSPSRRPRLQAGQLRQEDGRLQGVHAAVHPQELVLVV